MIRKFYPLTVLLTAALVALIIICLKTSALSSLNLILIVTVIVSILHGISMKIADLLDEHGMTSFKGSAIYYGILWGGFASLWVIIDVHLANAMLATILAFLVRMRLDYKNHAIAGAMVIVTFLTTSIFIPLEFAFLFVGLTVLGMFKDYMGEMNKANGLFYKLSEFASYSITTSLVYSFIFNNWIVFFAVTLSTVSYGLVKYYFHKWGYYKSL